jgi:hypothetical protein
MQDKVQAIVSSLKNLTDEEVDAVYKAVVEEGRKRKRPFGGRRAIR